MDMKPGLENSMPMLSETRNTVQNHFQRMKGKYET